jgi:predicted site-specific integrase-resolvase
MKNPESTQRELITAAALAKELGTSPQTVNSWCRKGIIKPYIAVGRIVRFEKETTIAALKNLPK